MSVIQVDIPTEIIREIVDLHRKDLPEPLAIKLAVQMYPWLGALLEILKIECHAVVESNTDALFAEALLSVKSDE